MTGTKRRRIIAVIVGVAVLAVAIWAVWPDSFLRRFVYRICWVAPHRRKTQDRWVAENVEALQSFRMTGEVRAVEADAGMGMPGEYFVNVGHGQVLRINQEEWVYFLMHSSHQDDFVEDETNWYVGDVAIAIDNAGELYRVNAHPCSCISVYPPNGSSFESIRDFAESRVEAHAGFAKWRKIVIEE